MSAQPARRLNRRALGVLKDTMKICILTLGTLGDVQPYIALGLGLKAVGHEVTISTLEEFKQIIHKNNLLHNNLRGYFLKAAQSAVGQKGNNPLQLIRKYVEMSKDTLEDEWESAREAEIIIYNPAALGGFHIAEKLGVPAFSAFPSPIYSPTREFPSPFFPFRNLGPFNKLSHQLFAKMGPAMYTGPINRFRKSILGLSPARGESKLRGKLIKKLYAYSETVVPRPADWDESSIITGYWFLDTPSNWKPDPELVKFLQEGSTPVYVGFGSMFMGGGRQKAEVILQALRLSGKRVILSKGWSGLSVEKGSKEIFVIDFVPHDWLFPRVEIIIHHGGAGTTGAAIRAGKPQIIFPFIGDQTFWGRRVADMGVGLSVNSKSKLKVNYLATIIQSATNINIQQRAQLLGERIRSENGVNYAVAYILGKQNW
jgi:sterol 3beta-glucosyltransferase